MALVGLIGVAALMVRSQTITVDDSDLALITYSTSPPWETGIDTIAQKPLPYSPFILCFTLRKIDDLK